MSAGTATASSAPPGPVAAGPMLRLTRGEGTFGGTWQGEGSRLGTWTMGVRVYGCNLHCGLLQGSWSARTAAIPPTHGTSRTIHNRSGPTRPPSTRSWRSWNGACSHGCGAAARGWCSSPAANPSSRGRRWASSCGLPGAGMAHPDRDQWHPAAEAAGRARLLARRLQRLTQAGDWHQPGADPASKRIRPKAIAELLATGRAVWKFVAAESRTWTRSTGGSNGSGCRSTTSGSCRRAPAPPA